MRIPVWGQGGLWEGEDMDFGGVWGRRGLDLRGPGGVGIGVWGLGTCWESGDMNLGGVWGCGDPSLGTGGTLGG